MRRASCGMQNQMCGQAPMPVSQAQHPVGSWLACESVSAVADAVTDTPPSLASPLPQEICASPAHFDVHDVVENSQIKPAD